MDLPKNLKMSKKYFDKKKFRAGVCSFAMKKNKKMEKKIWMRQVLNSHHLACKDGALDHLATKVIYLYCVKSKLIKQDPHNSKARQIQGYWPWAA